MIRCSTLLLQWGGQAVLTDPWFGMHVRGLPCLQRPGVRIADLPSIDAALVSHLHPDHFSRKALRDLAPAMVLVPPGTSAKLRGQQPRWHELNPGDSVTVGDVAISAVRGPHTLPGPEEINFVLTYPGLGNVFFGGDARLDGQVLRHARERHGPFRLALLPVGGTRICGRRTVMSPRDAADAADLLDAQTVVPIHEGGIWVSVPPLSLHPGRARHLVQIFERRGQPRRAVVLKPGESYTLTD